MNKIIFSIENNVPIYGMDLGKVYLKGDRITFPQETIDSIKENVPSGMTVFNSIFAIERSSGWTAVDIVALDSIEYLNEKQKEHACIKGADHSIYFPLYSGANRAKMDSDNSIPMELTHIKEGTFDYKKGSTYELELTIGFKTGLGVPGQDPDIFYIYNPKARIWITRQQPITHKVIRDSGTEHENWLDYFTVHDMHLKEEPYYKILSCKKIYELRLNDEKRQKLSEGDLIRFTKLDDETSFFHTRILDKKYYDSFEDLYDAACGNDDPITMERCGSSKDISKKDFLGRMNTYYSVEEQKKYGVVAIEIQLINSDETIRNIDAAVAKSKGRRDITFSFDTDSWREWNGVNTVYLQALSVAELAHRGTNRKMSDIPFIVHPIEVGSIVKDILYRDFRNNIIEYMDEIIAAAILHDVVEDTDIGIDEIELIFGRTVARLVGEESEDKRHEERPEDTWRIRKEEFLSELANAPEDARLITLADKLSNMRDMVVDYEELGENLWQKFNNHNKEDHAWYYKSVAEELGRVRKENERMPLGDLPEYKELCDLISKVFD